MSATIVTFAKTEIPAEGGYVSGLILHQDQPISATITGAWAEVVVNSNQYITVQAPIATAPNNTATLTITQNGATQTVTITQPTPLTQFAGFYANPKAVNLAATSATETVTLGGTPSHHYEITHGAEWLTIGVETTAEDKSTYYAASGIIPGSTAMQTVTVIATDNLVEDTTDTTTTAPQRTAEVTVRNLTTGEVLTLHIIQAGGKRSA